ncbi:type II toxin-antitoxin system Phd/YefM family antitoxin [soil metagenome]|jgi:prevent-host-death family protein|nr:type II toxin-antitoxin system Phd/YefM family antitoxin [Acidimicrobiia bacterium]
MDRVGVRDLKQNASRVLDRVKAGETVTVTEHGRPVALLTPLPDVDDYERLIETGDVLIGSQDILAGTPVDVGGRARMSDDLAALRRGDWR